MNSDDVGYSFQPTNLVVDSGGPNGFGNPTYNPAGSQYLPPLPLNLNNTSRFGSMDASPEESDMAAQEALARQYQPDLKVSFTIASCEKDEADRALGSAGREQEVQPCYR